MYLVQTIVKPYLPFVFVVGTFLLVVGLVCRALAGTRELKIWGNTIARYGVVVNIARHGSLGDH